MDNKIQNLHVSTLSTMKRCPKFYENKYIRKIYPRDTKKSLLIGRAFAKALEHYHLGKPYMKFILDLKDEMIEIGIDEQKASEDVIKLKTIFNEYLLKYHDQWEEFYPEFSTSTTIEVDGKEFFLNCKIDLLAKSKDGKWYIIDQKTSDKIDSHDSISTKLQPLIYPFVIMQEKELDEVIFMYDVIKKISGNSKCKIKTRASKKNPVAIYETLNEFEERMVTEYKEKNETNFKRIEFKILNDENTQIKVYNEIVNYLILKENYEAMNYYPCNELACSLFGGCDYKKLCDNNFEITEEFIDKNKIK